MDSAQNTQQKNHVLRVILLLLPAILFSAFVFVGSQLVYSVYLKSNSYFSLLVSDNRPTAASEGLTAALTKENLAYTEEEEKSEFDTGFPIIPYGSQWATLCVDGWARQDIPVFFGDTDTYLDQGAGMALGSKFCGQNGKCVLSAHVLTDFYQMEDLVVGTRVTMNTVYGVYVYQVREMVTFDKTETWRVQEEGQGDVLFMYTCYPRSRALTRTPTRLAAVCDLVEGYEYEAYQ